MTRQRNVFLAIALSCFAMIGAALYLQHVERLAPCPLCVIQRYAFLFAGIFSLVAAFAKKPLVWNVLGLASILGGLATAGDHLYVLSNPSFSCGIDPVENFLNKMPTAEWLPSVFASYGACESVDKLMGISIPAWSALWFVILGGALAAMVYKRRS